MRREGYTSGRVTMNAAKRILDDLLAGNQRFVSGTQHHPHCDVDYRKELGKGQNPRAVVITCSDSRTPPEIIFDQGLGDLFVIRTAGLCVDHIAIGSIEYAVEHLKVPLIVVMGHESCGAVNAAITGGAPTVHLESIIKFITPAVQKAQKEGLDKPEDVVRLNTANIVAHLKETEPILSNKVQDATVSIVGCHYNLESGVVELL